MFDRRRLLMMTTVLLLMLVTVFAAGCGSKSDDAKGAGKADVIKIGIAGPMKFIQGEHHWYGATMAQEEINSAGGIKVGDKNYQIELVKVDTNEILSVDDAVNALERAITLDKIDFITGGFRTEAVFPMTDLAAENKKIFIIAGSATDSLLVGRVDADYDKYKYLFRITPLKSSTLARMTFIQLGDVAKAVGRELGVKPKVAILAEKLEWNEALVAAAEQTIPQLGMEVVGTWRPSATAKDVTAELLAIKDSGAHIVYAANSGPIGVTIGRQWGELEIPAAMVGINVEAQKQGYWQATGGFGNYDATINTYNRVEITPKTIPFYDKFREKFGEAPIYTAGTYDAIYLLKQSIENAGTLDVDQIVEEMAKTEFAGINGKIVFDEYHDVTWGPGFVTGLGTQWQDGELVAFWPNKWSPAAGVEVTYKGVVDYKLPPKMIEYWKK